MMDLSQNVDLGQGFYAALCPLEFVHGVWEIKIFHTKVGWLKEDDSGYELSFLRIPTINVDTIEEAAQKAWEFYCVNLAMQMLQSHINIGIEVLMRSEMEQMLNALHLNDILAKKWATQEVKHYLRGYETTSAIDDECPW